MAVPLDCASYHNVYDWGVRVVASTYGDRANVESRVLIITDQQQTHNLAAIKEQLQQRFPTVTPQPWRFNIKLLRSTASNPENKQSSDTHFILRSSHFEDQAFLAVGVDEASPVVSIPAEQVDAYSKLLNDKFNTLWTPKMLFAITNGASYDLDELTIRLGELRVPGPTQAIRGILCNVQTSSSAIAGRQSEQEKAGRATVANVAETLGFVEAKKIYRTWASHDTAEEVKLWCEALNQRL